MILTWLALSFLAHASEITVPASWTIKTLPASGPIAKFTGGAQSQISRINPANNQAIYVYVYALDMIPSQLDVRSAKSWHDTVLGRDLGRHVLVDEHVFHQADGPNYQAYYTLDHGSLSRQDTLLRASVGAGKFYLFRYIDSRGVFLSNQALVRALFKDLQISDGAQKRKVALAHHIQIHRTLALATSHRLRD